MRGKRCTRARKTVRPPWPESNTPIMVEPVLPLPSDGLCGVEWIDNLDFEPLEVAHVASNDGQAPHNGCCGDHCIEGVIVRRPLHELGPDPEARRIDIHDLKRLHDLVEPVL